MNAPGGKNMVHGGIFLLANKIQAAGDRVNGQITSKQLALLRAISQMPEPHPTITQVAKFVDSTRQNVTKLLEQLALKRYVAITTLPNDRRGQGVALTNKAREHLAALSASDERFLDVLFSDVPDEDLEVVADVFDMLLENLERINEQAAREAAARRAARAAAREDEEDWDEEYDEYEE